MIVLWQRRVMQQACKCQARGNQCSRMGIPPMALGSGGTTLHKQGHIPRRSLTSPMHRRKKLDRRMPPMMRRRATVAMMVVAKVVGGGRYGKPPITEGDVPPV